MVRTRSSSKVSLPLPLPLPLPIPRDILIDILSRLPVKSLMRCKCVAKDWRALLTSAHFIKSHLDRAKQTNPRLIFTAKANPGITLSSLDYYETSNVAVNYSYNLSRDAFIVASCNGLVCLSDYETTVVICNPATNEYNSVFFGSIDPLPDDYTRKMVLGFGHDPVRDEYKVVRIEISHSITATVNVSVNDYKVYVNTVGTKKWRCIQNPGFLDNMRNVPYLNGALHCFKLSDDCKWNHTHKPVDSIISFDIRTERFGKVPWIQQGGAHSCLLGVLHECLCKSFYFVGTKQIDIWLMKEYGVEESWTKLISIGFPVERTRLIEPLVVRNTGEILLRHKYWVSDSIEDYLYVYDPVSKSVDARYQGVISWISVDTYMETLVPITSS